MKELFLLIKERLQKKEPLVLVTVTGSSGSTPREAGAQMLAGKGKEGPIRLWGSIGGGLPEHLAIEEAGALLQTRRTLFRKYTLQSGEAADLGARCGGELSVFFRSLDEGEPGLPELIERGLACFSDGKAAWLIMEVFESDGGPADKAAADFSMGLAATEGPVFFTGGGPANLKALLRPAPFRMEQEGKLWFSQALVSGGFVYVFGGGHVAQELVPLLAHLGFRCVVFDDREEFSRRELFPGAEKVILGDFKSPEKNISLKGDDYAVIVTRGHLWDLEAWAFALKSPAAYIGVIGSRTKHEFVKGQLRERGFGDGEINAGRVHAPIGIDIKSDTPAEIAVSIAAELVLARARLREEAQGKHGKPM